MICKVGYKLTTKRNVNILQNTFRGKSKQLLLLQMKKKPLILKNISKRLPAEHSQKNVYKIPVTLLQSDTSI